MSDKSSHHWKKQPGYRANNNKDNTVHPLQDEHWTIINMGLHTSHLSKSVPPRQWEHVIKRVKLKLFPHIKNLNIFRSIVFHPTTFFYITNFPTKIDCITQTVGS